MLALFALTLAGACKREAEQRESSASERAPAPEVKAPQPAAAHAPEPQPSAAEPQRPAEPRRAQFRVAQSTGAAEHEPAPLGAKFKVPQGAELSLDLVNGARVKLESGTKAWLLDAEPATIVLVEGALHAQLPPQGSAAGRPPLRIATGDYAVEMAVSGEFWLARPAARSGSVPARPAYFAQLSGTSDVEYVSSEATHGVVTQQLIPGQSWTGARPTAAMPDRGPKTLEDAKRTYDRLRGPSKIAKDAVDLGTFLESALAAWTEADLKGRAILAAQREANEKGEAKTVQAKQTELVSLAREKLALRKRVRFAFELACERAFASFADANSELARFEASYVPRVTPAMPSGS